MQTSVIPEKGRPEKDKSQSLEHPFMLDDPAPIFGKSRGIAFRPCPTSRHVANWIAELISACHCLFS